MEAQLKKLFQRRTAGNKSSLLHSQPYDSVVAQEAPIRGSYPIAGNGKEAIQGLETNHLKKITSTSSADISQRPRTSGSRRGSWIHIRPSTAPHSVSPTNKASKEPIPKMPLAKQVPRRHRNRESPLSSEITAVEEPPPSVDIFTASRIARPLASDTAHYSTYGAHIDILDAASIIPTHSRRKSSHVRIPDLRAKATGLKGYGEDVADRNIAASLKSRDLSSVDAFYRRENYLSSRRSSRNDSLRRQTPSYTSGSKSSSMLVGDGENEERTMIYEDIGKSEKRHISNGDRYADNQNPSWNQQQKNPEVKVYEAGMCGERDGDGNGRDNKRKRLERSTMGRDETGDDTPQLELQHGKGSLKATGKNRNINSRVHLQVPQQKKGGSRPRPPPAEYEPVAFHTHHDHPSRELNDTSNVGYGGEDLQSLDTSIHRPGGPPVVSRRSSSLTSKSIRFDMLQSPPLPSNPTHTDESGTRPQPARSVSFHTSNTNSPTFFAPAKTRTGSNPSSSAVPTPLVDFKKGVATLQKRQNSLETPPIVKPYNSARGSRSWREYLPLSQEAENTLESPQDQPLSSRTSAGSQITYDKLPRRLLSSAAASSSRPTSTSVNIERRNPRSRSVPSAAGASRRPSSDFDLSIDDEEEDMNRLSLDRPLPPLPADENGTRSSNRPFQVQQTDQGQTTGLPTPPISPQDQQKIEQQRIFRLSQSVGNMDIDNRKSRGSSRNSSRGPSKEFASEPSVRSHSGRSHSRNKRVVKSSDQPISLDGVVDLSNTEDTEVTTRTLPAVVHEHVIPTVHTVSEERIEQEMHTHDVFHRIQPIIDVEVLPTKHYMPDPDRPNALIEIPADSVPSRQNNWTINLNQTSHPRSFAQHTPTSDTSSQSLLSAKESRPAGVDGVVVPPHLHRAHIIENPVLASKREYTTEGGWTRTEYVWRHAPTLEPRHDGTVPIIMNCVDDADAKDYGRSGVEAQEGQMQQNLMRATGISAHESEEAIKTTGPMRVSPSRSVDDADFNNVTRPPVSASKVAPRGVESVRQRNSQFAHIIDDESPRTPIFSTFGANGNSLPGLQESNPITDHVDSYSGSDEKSLVPNELFPHHGSSNIGPKTRGSMLRPYDDESVNRSGPNADDGRDDLVKTGGSSRLPGEFPTTPLDEFSQEQGDTNQALRRRKDADDLRRNVRGDSIGSRLHDGMLEKSPNSSIPTIVGNADAKIGNYEFENGGVKKTSLGREIVQDSKMQDPKMAGVTQKLSMLDV